MLPSTAELEARISVLIAPIRAQISKAVAWGENVESIGDYEEVLERQLAKLGAELMQEALQAMDPGKDALLSSHEAGKLTAKSTAVKHVVETVFAPVEVSCHVFQSSAGGATRVPLVERARLIRAATPRFAWVVAAKVAQLPAASVVRDLQMHHGRKICAQFARQLAAEVAAIATVVAGDIPLRPLSKVAEVATIQLGVDAASLNTREGGWRMAMCGSLTLLDQAAHPLETFYFGAGPGATSTESRAAFFQHMGQRFDELRVLYPQATTVGISDAASDLQSFIQRTVKVALVDYHHAAEYVSAAAPSCCPTHSRTSRTSRNWGTTLRHTLSDAPQGATQVLTKLKEQQTRDDRHMSQVRGSILPSELRESLDKAITYLSNHHEKMDYYGAKAAGLPIGSGATEAACKVLIKQRMCASGMRWSLDGADALLRLRALYLNPTQWADFCSAYSKA
jgi:hypothetical protein